MREWKRWLGLQLCAAAVAACGSRSSLSDLEEQDASNDDVVDEVPLLPPRACDDWANWSPVPAAEMPRSKSETFVCAATCRERFAARITIFCAFSTDCYCLVGSPGNPNGYYGYTSCHLAGIASLFEFHDAASCEKTFENYIAKGKTSCLERARSAECIECCSEGDP